jgi:hypothetical protein
MNLLESLKRVAYLRAIITNLKANINGRREEVEATLAPIISEVKTKELELQAAEDEARKIAIDLFEITGEKTLAGNVKVRERTNLVFNDRDAKEWCETNMPVAFERVWNKKTFTDFAKAHDLPFVQKETVPEALLPREITLPEEAPAA